jgi:hypothetical protein
VRGVKDFRITPIAARRDAACSPTRRDAVEELMTMPKGGHARSGPAKDPSSRTSERAGYTLTALPNEGYRAGPRAEPVPAEADGPASTGVD